MHQAYLDCRKNKRNKPDALAFEINAEENLYFLRQELVNGIYHPSSSDCFIVNKPKLREIIAADFKDRIVHHLLVRYLEKIFEPVFIFNSFASRKKKGLHAGVKRLKQYALKVSSNNTSKAFYMQLDIKNFFMEINKKILYCLIEKKCKNPEMLWLARVIIFNDPTKNIRLKSSHKKLKNIPAHKSLFGRDSNQGLPIGNLTSQFFANVYLNELDQFVKHTLKCQFYLRYVDDFVLLDQDISRLKEMKKRIQLFLAKRLKLELNQSLQKLLPLSNGIDFLGYVVRPKYVLCRRRVVDNLKARLTVFKEKLIVLKNGVLHIYFSKKVVEELYLCLNSYFAHFYHANTFKLISKLFEHHSWLGYYLSYSDKKISPFNYQYNFTCLKKQYRYFINKFSMHIIFFQVGCYYEFYMFQAKLACQVLNLKMIQPKFGFKLRCGIHKKYLAQYLSQAIGSGWQALLVNQTGYYGSFIAHRAVLARYIPLDTKRAEKFLQGSGIEKLL